jgi:hypothetical protein
MAYAVAQEIPGVTEDMFGRVVAALETAVPDGLIVHASAVTPTGLRMIEVWESKAAWDAYVRTQVEPARARVRVPGDVVDEPDHDHLEIAEVQRLIVGHGYTASAPQE